MATVFQAIRHGCTNCGSSPNLGDIYTKIHFVPFFNSNKVNSSLLQPNKYENTIK